VYVGIVSGRYGCGGRGAGRGKLEASKAVPTKITLEGALEAYGKAGVGRAEQETLPAEGWYAARL